MAMSIVARMSEREIRVFATIVPGCRFAHPGYVDSNFQTAVFYAATTSRSRRACARVLPGTSRPSNIRGRRECRALDAPAAACVDVESTRVSHHGHTGITRHSPRNGFNGFLRALPGDRACLPPSPADTSAKLDTSVGASGPHDFAVRLKRRSSLSAISVHRIPPHVRDDRETPLMWGGTGAGIGMIWAAMEAEYFCEGRLDST
jgi:hypothetical protein